MNLLGGGYLLLILFSYILPYEIAFIILFAVIGILQGPVWGAGVTILDNWLPRKYRGRGLGLFGTSAPIGNIIGALLAPLVYIVLQTTWH